MRRVMLMLGLNIAMVAMLVGCGEKDSNISSENSSNQDVVQIQPSTDVEDTEQMVEEVAQENMADDTITEDIQNNEINDVTQDMNSTDNGGANDVVSNDTNSNNSANSQENYITEVEAKEIALVHAGVNEADTKYLTVKFEYDNGIAEYEVEWDVERVEYEYEINAITGDILGFSKDLD